MHIDKAGRLDGRAHRVDNVEETAGFFAYTQETVPPLCERAVGVNRAVVTVVSDFRLDLLDSTAWNEGVVGLGVEVGPLLGGE